MTEQITMIPARLKNAAVNGHVAGAADIIDDAKAKTQDVINQDVDTAIGDDDVEGSIKGRIKALEEAVGPGGSVKEQIDAKVATLDASVSQTAGADGLALSVTEVDGIVTSVSGSIAANTYDAYGSASAEATRAQGVESTLQGNIGAIEAKIPTQASSTNQLADKKFVNSSISTSTATFRGTSEAGLTEQQFLAWANTLTKDANDYVFWNTADAAGNVQFKRYKYNGTTWEYEYTLNNSSFTSEQWAAIQSGITDTLVGKLDALPTNAELTTAITGKVDKVTGKGLSTNDYTTDEKNKLAGIAAGAEVNVQSDWNATSGDAFIKNKPTIPAAAANGTYTVKTLVESTTTNVSDFTANQSSADDVTFVQGSNVTITPDATNRKITIAAKDTTYSSKTAASGGTDVSLVTTGEKYTWNNKQDALVSGTNIKTINSQSLLGSGDIVIEGGGNDVDVNYDTTNKKITKTIDGTTTDVVTAAKIVTDGGGIKDISGKVDKTTTVNGHALSGNVSVTKSDVGLGNVGNFKAVSTVASQGLSDIEKTNARANIGAGTSSFSGSYNDLSNKPTIPTVNNGKLTIKQNGISKGTFTANQSGASTVELTDTIEVEIGETAPTGTPKLFVDEDADPEGVLDIYTRAQTDTLLAEKADKATTIAGYGITDAYTKTEVNGLVDTPHQEYVTVDAYANLPETGSKDSIYRVSNYNGSTSQVDASVYSEYAWNGTQYIFLCVKSQIGEVFDISVYNNNAKYTNLTDALGTNGEHVPQSLRKGGMSVKYVSSSDNKYVQYRLMAQSFSTTESDWQGVDDEPTPGSNNLTKSNGVLKSDIDFSKITFYYGSLQNTGAIYINLTQKNRLCSSYIKGPFEYVLNSNYRAVSACKYNSVGKFISYTASNIDTFCRNNERDNLILISLGRNDNGTIEDNYRDIISINSLMLSSIDESITVLNTEFNASIFGKEVTLSSNTNIPVKLAKGEVMSITTDKGFGFSVISNGVQEVIKTFTNAGTYIYKAEKNIEYIRIADFTAPITISLQKVKYDNVINALRCNSVIKGSVSIIGDSISTFKGTMPSGYAAYYPDSRVNVTCVGSMWWKLLLDSGNNNELVENLSWSGSCATNYRTDGRPSLCDRISALSNTPDYLFIALGTNDSTENVPLGNYNYDSEISNLDESKFREAFIKGIKLIQRDFATTKVVLLAFDMADSYKNSLVSIAEHYNIPIVNIIGYDNYQRNPTKKGMEKAASEVVNVLSNFEWNNAIKDTVELIQGVAGEIVTREIKQATNIPFEIAAGDSIIITNDGVCSFSYISNNTQYNIKRNVAAGTNEYTIPRDAQVIRITDIVNTPTTVTIKRKTASQYLQDAEDYTDGRILGKVETASLTSNENIDFTASTGEKIVITIDRECSISLIYQSGQQVYRLHAPVGWYSIVLTDNLNAVRFTDLVSVTNVRIRLDNSLTEETDIELDALQYGVEKFIANNGANFYSQLAVMYNSAKNNTDTVLKRVTTNVIQFAHMPQMIIKDGIVYLSYLQNTGDDGEGTYSTTSSVVLAKFSLSDFNSDNFNPSTDVDIFEIGKLGDTFANYQAKSIFKDNSMCLVGDIIYIPFMFITEEENAARMFVAAFDTTTDTITSKQASTISYGSDSLDFTINTINTIYIKEGYNVVPVTNNIIELVSEWSIYNNEYYATLICSGGKGNTGMIVKTSNFVNYTFVSCIPFNENGEAEIASIVFDGKLYVACRQNYGIPYLMLGYYNLSNGTWSNPTKIADGNSRPWFFVYNSKLYLANTIHEYSRHYFNISEVSTSNYVGKNVPTRIISTYYQMGQYYAMTTSNNKLYMVTRKNTISFGELKLSEMDVSQAQQKLLDLFA